MSTAVLERDSTTSAGGWIELDPPVRYRTLHEARFGPRTYTSEQVAFIEQVVSERAPLTDEPIHLDD
jgi:hypothetical protein